MPRFDLWPMFFKREWNRNWPFLVGFAITGTIITKFSLDLSEEDAKSSAFVQRNKRLGILAPFFCWYALKIPPYGEKRFNRLKTKLQKIQLAMDIQTTRHRLEIKAERRKRKLECQFIYCNFNDIGTLFRILFWEIMRKQCEQDCNFHVVGTLFKILFWKIMRKQCEQDCNFHVVGTLFRILYQVVFILD